jgi:hypothetical protein
MIQSAIPLPRLRSSRALLFLVPGSPCGHLRQGSYSYWHHLSSPSHKRLLVCSFSINHSNENISSIICSFFSVCFPLAVHVWQFLGSNTCTAISHESCIRKMIASCGELWHFLFLTNTGSHKQVTSNHLPHIKTDPSSSSRNLSIFFTSLQLSHQHTCRDYSNSTMPSLLFDTI